MKTMMKIALTLTILLGITSCEVFDVDVESTMSGTLEIVVPDGTLKSTSDVFPFNSFTTINPLDDPDVSEYADKIVSVGVDGIIAVVESVSDGGVMFLSGSSLTISNENHTSTYTLTDDWSIEAGTTLNISDLDGFYDDVSEILLEMETFTVTMIGNSSKSGVDVTIRIDMETVITGNLF